MADQYYIDDDYYTPDGYFVYTADAAASVSSISTLSTPGESTKTFSCSISATSSVTAVGVETSELVLSAFGQCVLTCDAVKTTDIDETLNSITTTSVSERRLRSTDLSASSITTATISAGRIVEPRRYPPATLSGLYGYTIQVASGKFNNALYISDAVSDPEMAKIDFAGELGSGVGAADPGTIEFWIKGGVETPGADANFTEVGSASSGDPPILVFGSNDLKWTSGANTVVLETYYTGSDFHHLAITTPGNDTWYFWYDGVYKGSMNVTAGSAFRDFIWGKSSGASIFEIWMDEFRASTVQRYTNGVNFTPASNPFANDENTIALFHFDTTGQGDDVGLGYVGQFNLTADGLKLKNFASSIASTTTLTANVLKIIDGAANLQSTSTVTIVGGNRKEFSSTINSTTQVSALASATKVGTGSFSTTTSLTCLGVTNRDIVLSAFGDAQVTVTATVTRGLTASLQATSSAVTTANQTADIACVIQSTSSVTANVNRTASLSANFTTLANIVAINEGFEGGEATLLSTTTLTSAPVKTARITQSLQSISQIAVDLRRTVRFICVMQGQGFQLSEGEVLTSDPDLTFRVLPENRTWAIDQETGIIQVLSENRINTVEQETGEYQVLPETRILA